MMKIKLSILMILIVGLTTTYSQWQNEGDWPNQSYTGGTHGIAVDPDGKVWTASHYKHDSWITPDSITIATSAIIVFNPDGTETDFSPIHFVLNNNGSIVDTLNGNCRGLATDEVGNILYVQSSPGKIYKIDYKTGEGIARRAIDGDLGTSPTKPAVADDGTIFVGPVISGGINPIVMYTPELELFGNAMIGPPGVSRTMEVSPDGNTIYWMAFDLNKLYIMDRPDVFTNFSVTDSIVGFTIESSAWQPETNLLWVSNDDRGDYSHLTWYGLDVTNKSVVDSIAWTPNTNTAELARGIDFSPDGLVAYIGTFEVSTAKIQKIINTATDVDLLIDYIPSNFGLKQNYPNPFNPTTTIEFTIPITSYVSLKIYNVQGQEIANLVEENLSPGEYRKKFDSKNLSSGLYFYVLNSNAINISKKMIILK